MDYYHLYRDLKRENKKEDKERSWFWSQVSPPLQSVWHWLGMKGTINEFWSWFPFAGSFISHFSTFYFLYFIPQIVSPKSLVKYFLPDTLILCLSLNLSRLAASWFCPRSKNQLKPSQCSLPLSNKTLSSHNRPWAVVTEAASLCLSSR